MAVVARNEDRRPRRKAVTEGALEDTFVIWFWSTVRGERVAGSVPELSKQRAKRAGKTKPVFKASRAVRYGPRGDREESNTASYCFVKQKKTSPWYRNGAENNKPGVTIGKQKSEMGGTNKRKRRMKTSNNPREIIRMWFMGAIK